MSIVTSKYLADIEDKKKSLPISKVTGGSDLRTYGEITRASDLAAFKIRLLAFIRCNTLESSKFAWNCISLSVFPIINKAVSSAKNLGRDCKQDGRSLI